MGSGKSVFQQRQPCSGASTVKSLGWKATVPIVGPKASDSKDPQRVAPQDCDHCSEHVTPAGNRESTDSIHKRCPKRIAFESNNKDVNSQTPRLWCDDMLLHGSLTPCTDSDVLTPTAHALTATCAAIDQSKRLLEVWADTQPLQCVRSNNEKTMFSFIV